MDISPKHALELSEFIGRYERLLADPLLVAMDSTLQENYDRLWMKVCCYTNSFLFQTVYSIDGIIPPVNLNRIN